MFNRMWKDYSVICLLYPSVGTDTLPGITITLSRAYKCFAASVSTLYRIIRVRLHSYLLPLKCQYFDCDRREVIHIVYIVRFISGGEECEMVLHACCIIIA